MCVCVSVGNLVVCLYNEAQPNMPPGASSASFPVLGSVAVVLRPSRALGETIIKIQFLGLSACSAESESGGGTLEILFS